MPPGGISFDISDDAQFKTFVVQKLTQLEERTSALDEIKARTDRVLVLESEVADIRQSARDEKKWNNYKAAAGPIMVVIHGILHKFGIF
jgi:hypothetical protein